ncbi:hypothetical protein ALC56_07206 [Trachymyrmex septentrionalis]|uniref:GIY-YIG domain-containing protein n=1 Tax=Trachymyrmex septentrionalis TaxID=34720 RepID=A0A151JW02_9HYME|nr:hypothetical protein ALC56_07206 [Trachymyrmex septentrionalis]
MNTFIKTGKDKIKKEDHSNVMYKINCLDCNYSYVGQTKRKLKTHLKEYINDFKKVTNIMSVISLHKLDHDHSIDWNNMIILDSEQFYIQLKYFFIEDEEFPLLMNLRPYSGRNLNLHNFLKSEKCFEEDVINGAWRENDVHIQNIQSCNARRITIQAYEQQDKKSAVESVTYAFPEISPSTIMTEALRVLDEASSAQRETSTMKGDFRRKIIVGVEVAKQAISGEGGELGQDSGASEDIEGTMSPA